MKDDLIRLQVWSDYVCPFCYLELPVLERIQSEYGDRLSVEWKAFELRPEPTPPLEVDGAYMEDVWSQSVYPMAEERGVVVRMPPVQPRSRLAHEAAAFARDNDQFMPMHRALLRAFFEDGRDIGELDVILDIAGEAGLDPEALRRSIDEKQYTDRVAGERMLAKQLGIDGVPTIVALAPGETLQSEEAEGVAGAQPDSTLKRLVERAAKRRR